MRLSSIDQIVDAIIIAIKDGSPHPVTGKAITWIDIKKMLYDTVKHESEEFIKYKKEFPEKSFEDYLLKCMNNLNKLNYKAMAVKTDSNGRKYVDYTRGKTFYEFETSSSSKIMMHLLSHSIIIFCWVKVIIGWEEIALYNGDTFSLVMGWAVVGILIVVPILYWGMSYRKYKQLQKGISS